MEATIIQKFLPFIILFLSWMSSISHPKIFYLTLPAMAVCFHLYYPGSWTVQIILLFIWALFLMGTYRVATFSLVEIHRNKPLFIVLIALSVAATAFLLIWWNPKDIWNVKGLLAMTAGLAFGTATFYYNIIIPIVMRVIAPLFVKSETTVNTTLADYYKIAKGGARFKFWHSRIRFKDDPLLYEVGVIPFRRYRNKVGVPFSYIRCECLFGVHYIYAVRQLSLTPGSPSQWESSPTTKIENKIKKYVLIFGIATIVLFLIVVGIAILLLKQRG